MAAVERAPEATALRFAGRSLTYTELDQWSSRLARVLIARGLGPGDRIVLALTRSIESVVAVWAAAKCGATFVPVDPRYPAERVAHMLGDSGAGFGLAMAADAARLDTGIRWLSIDSAAYQAELAAASDEPVCAGERTAQLRPDELAYIIYTSGSTGVPKGVSVTHTGLAGLCAEQVRRFAIDTDSRTVHFASPSFDASMLELLLAVGASATMVIAPPDVYGGDELTELLRTEGVTHAFITPAALAGLDATALPELRVLAVGGEAYPPELIAQWAPGRSFFNVYGPTETTIVCAMSDRLDPGDVVTIGDTIPGMTAVVLDARLHPVPDRVPGELYLAGAGLARCYHDRAGLTASRFVADPVTGGRLYRTGDLVQWEPVPGGMGLKFLGRTDAQVKLRGFRIELGEIDAVLSADDSVHFAATLIRTLPSGVDALVAYVVPAPGATVDPAALTRLAEQRLPQHAVPSAVVVLDELPLTPVGKLDHRALPDPELTTREFAEPRTDAERTVAEVFAELLGTDRVGRDDDFFALGGNSLLATRLAGRLGALTGVRVPARTVFEHASVAALATALADLVADTRVPLTRRERGARIPLSLAQQRMWFMARLDPDASTYNIPVALRLCGPLDTAALTAALDDVLERHEVLRTVYPEHDGQGYQQVLPVAAAGLEVAVTAIEEADLRGELARITFGGFDVCARVPVRATVFQLSATEHVLAVVVHHIATDGFSLGPLTRDLMTAYIARTEGHAPAWSPLPVQYADYTLWQHELLGAADDPASLLARQLDFWRTALAGAPALLELPTDRPRPPIASTRGAAHHFAFDADLHRALEILAREHNASLFMVVRTALAVLLARMAGTDDVTLGAPVAGRGEPELDDLVGMFVNTVVLRTRIAAGEPFTALLDRVRESDLAAFGHADVPFERLVAELDPPRTQAHHPLYQVALSFQNFGAARLELPELSVAAVDLGDEVAPVDLQLTVVPQEDGDGPAGLRCSWRYATALFDESTMAALGARLGTLLAAAVAHPDRAVGDLPLLTESERTEPAGELRLVPDVTLLDEFRTQASRTPEAPAVTFADRTLTYRELASRVNRLARLLVATGVGPGSTVGVAIRPSLDLVVAMYAVFAAGGAYVPIDPESPAERRADILTAARPACVLSTVADTVEVDDLPVISVDLVANSGALNAFSDTWLTDADRLRPLRTLDLAYVIFTSGSTGKPKGVGVPHSAIVNQTAYMVGEYAVGAVDVVLQSIPFTFDASMIGFATPLRAGAHMVVAAAHGLTDPAYLADIIARHGVTGTTIVPSVLQMLLDAAPAGALRSLRAVWVGGEALPNATVARFAAATSGRLHNLYGPTEATVSITAADVTEVGDGIVPIGLPHWNSRAYVLDARLRPVPLGTPGELYLAGAQLARGYLGSPGRTMERFVADPYGPVGERMYRTGDLVRRLPTGELTYLGRTDVQLKLHGLRIEPGEIEAALRAHPSVAGAAVTVHHEQLVGYVTPSGVDVAEVLATARTLLPPYMIPHRVLALDEFPLGATGKLDRKALPAPAREIREYQAPVTDDERVVAEVFASVLELERVGRDDDFFVLGGTSLSAIRVRASLAERLGIEVALRLLFSYPLVSDLALALRDEKAASSTGPDPALDRVLDPSITLDGCVPPRSGEPANILLTGATGFLGSFLLRELLEHTTATVHCLVRAADAHTALDRVVATAAGYGIEVDRARLAGVPGDLARPQLGIDPRRFAELADRIDVIYHNGALVNHLEPYGRMREANVGGTTEVLRLATTTRVKAVHYVSTTSVLAGIPQADGVPAGLPGYALTKWVAEQLMHTAAERGVPIAVYRPGLITGDSRTGVAPAEDAWWTMLRSMLVLGTAVDVRSVAIGMAPVDYVAAGIVRRSRDDSALGQVFRAAGPEVPLGIVYDEIVRRGYRFDFIDPMEFGQILTTAAEQPGVDPMLARASALSGNYVAAVAAAGASSVLDAVESSSVESAETLPIDIPAVDAAVIARYFDHYIETGFFPAPAGVA
ncbi:non-ribosomal peptide synthetase [Nocardia coubleae]|uniref:Amino acid adenylation domain-containing protein n=1 Tax=Nocardia coubleae TaxID=356147 RepID=A0A846W5N9_9NOCA|nr:non-ribosomal peptide synthetase [Nocardia coubleae]NKX88034.1 amino acid adenylation domain-containing protein [Nocardia coubleae]